MTGVGLISGPILGSSLYSILGYQNTFFIYGGVLILGAILIKIRFPAGNQRVTIDDRDDRYFDIDTSISSQEE